MAITKTVLKEDFILRNIITIQYFEFNKRFSYIEEQHEYWEMVYVDRGDVMILCDTQWINLNQGQIAFHKPGELHNLRANGEVAPNIILVTFDCHSPAMRFFAKRIMDVNNSEKHLLATIIKEAGHAFRPPFDNPCSEGLDRLETPLIIGSEQLIKISMEQLLISLYRNNSPKKDKNLSILKERRDMNVVEKTIAYLKENIYASLTFDDICNHASTSSTALRSIFKNQTGKSVMQYYRELKIRQARILIRENSYNMTQISELLKYENLHHFSNQFKRITGITPTEYAKSAKLEFDE